MTGPRSFSELLNSGKFEIPILSHYMSVPKRKPWRPPQKPLAFSRCSKLPLFSTLFLLSGEARKEVSTGKRCSCHGAMATMVVITTLRDRNDLLKQIKYVHTYVPEKSKEKAQLATVISKELHQLLGYKLL